MFYSRFSLSRDANRQGGGLNKIRPVKSLTVTADQDIWELEKRSAIIGALIAVGGKKILLEYTSGVILDDEYILTANHLIPILIPGGCSFENLVIEASLPYYPELKNPVSLKIERSCPEKDLLLLKMVRQDFIKLEPIRLAKNIKLGESATIIGTPSPLFHLRNSCIIPARIINFSREGIIYLDYQAVSGLSGSGVWNKKGELVGIVKEVLRDESLGEFVFTGVISSKVISDFLQQKNK